MNTRRTFLQAGAGLAAGLAGASAADVQVPRMKFFDTEISRLVLGVNTFNGYAHFNANFGNAMRDWYTQERVCDVLHRCNQFGINAFNFVNRGRTPQDWARFVSEGGKMHLIIQVVENDDEAAMVKDLKAFALHRQGEIVDRAYQTGHLDTVREWCKKVRDLGVRVGVATHKPEVIARIEEEGWDIDYYTGCVYNRTRTPDEWRKVLNGELLEMPSEIYLQSDPPRMYKVMRQTRKPCFAFKILAAGRVGDRAVEQAFRNAFESIKPTDGVFVGMFPRYKDEVRENAEIVHRILTRG